MTVPAVTISIQDGQLGVVSTGSSVQAVLGISSTGTPNQPSSFSTVRDLTDAFGSGPGVEAAALAIQAGSSVQFVKIAQAADGTHGTISTSVAGTSVITVDAATTKPADDFDLQVVFTTGGTRGTAGIKYRYSYDGGRSLSPTQALGTLTKIEVPDAVTFALAAGTIVAGDSVSLRANAPTYSTTELGAALDAFALSNVRCRTVHVVGPMTASLGGIVDSKLTAMAAASKPRAWLGNTRMPNAGETDAAYQTAMQAISDAYSTVRGALCAGAVKQISAVSGRQYRRPLSFRVAAEQSTASEEIDIADVNRGALVGTQLLDDNGNPEAQFHDEASRPGLDDMRFITARTWPTLAGVYVTRPRVFSAEGSDFRLIPHRLVMDLAHETAYGNLLRRLNQPVIIDSATGRITEADAKEIEAGCTAALSAALLAKPKASAVSVSVSRTDNLLSTGVLHVTIRVIPLAYIEFLEVQLSFSNPALLAA